MVDTMENKTTFFLQDSPLGIYIGKNSMGMPKYIAKDILLYNLRAYYGDQKVEDLEDGIGIDLNSSDDPSYFWNNFNDLIRNPIGKLRDDWWSLPLTI